MVNLQGDLGKRAGTGSVRVPIEEEETLDSLFMKLSRRHPQVVESILDPTTGELSENCQVLLNNRPVKRTLGIHTKLKHKDEITILPLEKEQDPQVV
ncbi:MAG: MoaD/ThiS family protein [Candidatus Hadarchaeales archaeon]